MKPGLYLVPTPIGNLDDISHRSLKMLEEAHIIFAEDTRVCKRLLSHFNISKNVQSFHHNNEHKVLERTIETIKQNPVSVLVSDAGTPAISDPGFLLVRACIENEIHVECLPGPVAFVPALVASGLPCDSFVFEGFLPHKKGRQTKLKELAEENRTVILYESPHRIKKLAVEISTFFGTDRKMVVAREISKLYEEFIRGTAQEILTELEQREIKGEIVVVIQGKSKK